MGFGALLGALVHIGIRPSIDPVTVALSMLVVAAYALRELYGGIQRGRLLGVLTDQAMHDPLTGLGNRRAMQTGLARLAVEPSGAVLTLDLDGFKEVNDLLGHGLGDRLLVAVAGRIRDAMPANAEAFRVGGDEFVVLVPGEQECSTAVAEALLAGVRRATESLPEADVAGVSAERRGGALVRGRRRDGARRGAAHRPGRAARPWRSWSPGSRCTPPRSPVGTGSRATTARWPPGTAAAWTSSAGCASPWPRATSTCTTSPSCRWTPVGWSASRRWRAGPTRCSDGSDRTSSSRSPSGRR